MTFEPKKLEDIEPLQVSVKGLNIAELLNSDFSKFLNEKYSDRFLIRPSELTVTLISKEKREPIKSKKGKTITIAIDPLAFLRLSHHSEKEYKNKIAIITSPNKDILKRFIESGEK